MRLGIVIPTLNESKSLPRLLADLAAQNHQEFCCVIVDGGSSDGTETLARRWMKRDSRFSLLRSSIANVSAQRNMGAQCIDGQSECILFLDADTRVNPTFLSNLLSQWKHTWVAATVFAIPDTTRLSDRFFLSLQNYLYRVFAFFGRPYCWGACLLVSSDAFTQLGGFDETIAHMEDSELVQRLCSTTSTRFVVLTHPHFTFSMRRYRSQSKLKHVMKLVPTFARSFFKRQFSTAESLYPMHNPTHRTGK